MLKLMEKYKKLPLPLKASLWFLICGVIQKGLAMVTTPIFTRILTTAEYGEYSVFNSWHNILTVFITLNLTAGVYSQGLVKFSEDREKFSSSLYGLTLLLSAVAFVIYIAGHKLWNSLIGLSTIVMVCMLVMTCVSTFFGFWSAKQRVDYKYKTLIILTLSIAVVRPVSEIAAMILFPNAKVTARIIAITVIDILVYIWLLFAQIKKDAHLYDGFYWKYALKFNIPLVPHYLSQTVLSSSDRIMIERMRSQSDAGIYNLAYSLSMMLLIVNTAVMNTLSPWMYQKIKDKKYDDMAKPAYILLAVIGGVCLMLIACAPEAVAIFAPTEYSAAKWAVPPVVMSVYFIFMYDLIAKFAFYFEKTKFVMVASVVCAAANIGLNGIFIPIFGFIAAAYTTLACYILYDICHYVFMRIIARKYMEGNMVYNPLILLGISVVFVALGFGIMAFYNLHVIRYGIIATGLIIMLIKRKAIIGFFSKNKSVGEAK